MATSSEQLEREAEETRADLQSAIEELRYRITPGQILDQAIEFARDGQAGEFVENLRDQVVRRPLPLLLIGAGLAWLMLPGRSNPAAGSRRAAAAPVSSPIGEEAHPVVGDAADSPVHDQADAGLVDRITRFCREQPLVVAGAGLAAGALVGAVVARTAIGDRTAGPADEPELDEMQEAAAEQLQTAVAAARADGAAAPASGEGLPQVAESLGIVPDHHKGSDLTGGSGRSQGPAGRGPDESPDRHG